MHLKTVRAMCSRRQRSIDLAVRGPQGARGAAGPRGPAGVPADQSAVIALQTEVASLRNTLSVLQADNSTLKTQVASLSGLLTGVSRVGNELTFSGMNVEINSGAGHTDVRNGLGNLFLGYNEFPGTQTGSNNLVLGGLQTFTSYGGLIAGQQNTVTAPYASVTGGTGNTASSTYSAVTGGGGNTASGYVSAVTGGEYNLAAAQGSAVTGGHNITVTTDDGRG